MTLNTYSTDEAPQRSEEWLRLRAGMVTASVVGQLVTTKQLTAIDFACPACEAPTRESCRSKRTGQPIATLHLERAAVAKADTSPPVLTLADGETTRKLAALLVAERITNAVDPDAQLGGRDIWRGIDSEDPAREKYAEHYQVDVTQCGFIVLEDDGLRLGYSPDGLVGDDGLIEIKSPRQRGHVETVNGGEVPAFHMPQIQAGLLVSGRAWCDFISFNGGMHLWVKRVLPDPAWFKAITAAVTEFETTIEQMVTTYRAGVEGFPMTERLPETTEMY